MDKHWTSIGHADKLRASLDCPRRRPVRARAPTSAGASGWSPTTCCDLRTSSTCGRPLAALYFLLAAFCWLPLRLALPAGGQDEPPRQPEARGRGASARGARRRLGRARFVYLRGASRNCRRAGHTREAAPICFGIGRKSSRRPRKCALWSAPAGPKEAAWRVCGTACACLSASKSASVRGAPGRVAADWPPREWG